MIYEIHGKEMPKNQVRLYPVFPGGCSMDQKNPSILFFSPFPCGSHSEYGEFEADGPSMWY
jgi:hypothetical protein